MLIIIGINVKKCKNIRVYSCDNPGRVLERPGFSLFIKISRNDTLLFKLVFRSYSIVT